MASCIAEKSAQASAPKDSANRLHTSTNPR